MANVVDIYPLSPIQQGILFHSLYSPESGVYMVQTHCVLQPAPDVSAFERAWNEVIKRHDIFRTAFEWKEVDDAVQVLYDQAEISLTQCDWRGQSKPEQRKRLQEYLVTDRRRGFDFSAPPLLRLMLINLDDESSQFIWTVHHLLMDTWSEVLLFDEFSSFYNAFANGRTIQTEPAPSYRDYVKWIKQQDLSEADAFWRQSLKGFETPTQFGTARNFRSETRETYESQQISLSVETTIALQALGRQQEVTLNTVTQGAWALLLSRYSGERDVVFGMTVSGRPFSLEGAEHIIGPFLNTLPLRVQLPPDTTLSAWLQELQLRSTDLLMFEYSPLVRVQRLSDVQNGLPLFESIYVFESAPVNPLQKEKDSANGSLAIRDAGTIQSSNYPIAVLISPGRQLSLEIIYDSSAFASETIARMLEHLRNLLEGMASRPTARLRDLPMLSETERRVLLHDWNKTAVDYGLGCLHEVIEAQAKRTPDAVALCFEEQQLTYRELDERANQLAHYLKRRGVGAEVLVGIMMQRSLEMVVALLGILKAGGAYVPLDASYPAARLRYMLQDCGARLLLTQGRLAALVPEVTASETEVQVIKVDEQWAEIALESKAASASTVNEDNLAYLIYTSGSTGKPKGVMIAHAGVTNHMAWLQEVHPLDERDAMLQKTSFSFDASMLEFYWPLMYGARLVLARDKADLDTEYLTSLMDAQQITTVYFPASALQMFLANRKAGTCQWLKYACSAAEVMPLAVEKEFYAQFPLAELHNLYGPTEASIDVTWWRCEPESRRRSVPIGRPIANTQVYVLDEGLEPVPVGVAGELYLSGVGLARGYWGQAGLTAERFVPNAYGESGGRLYRTGDLVRHLADGELEFLGRVDSQVKLRGYRIELGEIESVLRRNDRVRDAIVVAREQSGGEKQLAVYVVPATDVEPGELRKWLKERLPEYMIPAAFILLKELPLTPGGKVDRRALSNANLQEVRPAESFIAPRNQTEIILAGIWTEVLQVENVGAEANFFDLGGHSLLVMRMASKLREHFKIDLPLRTILAAANLPEMAREVEAALHTGAAVEMQPIHRRSTDQQAPLSFAQQRLWLIQQLEPESTAYNVYNVTRLRGPLNVVALEKALNEIVRRHEILRTTFTTSGDQLVQIVAPFAPLRFTVEDLSILPAAKREAEVQRAALEEARVVFDLKRGPLYRVRLLRLNDEHVLITCRHHIIFDLWSHEVLTTELVSLYEAFDKEQASPLPELQIQYADFACWERDWLAGDKLNTLLRYWKKQLEGAPAELNLPVDGVASAASSYRGKWQSFTLDKEQTKTIRTLSQTEHVTVYMVLVAAFKTFIYRYSGQPDFVIGTPVTNRPQPETEPLIGCFMNVLVLRTDLSGNPTFRELLGRVRETVLGAYTHQELPFERLIEELKIGRAQTSTPLVQVLFSHVKPLPAAQKKIAGLELSPMDVEEECAKADWMMLMVELGDEIVSTLQYRIDLFDDETIRRAMGHFQNLFHSILKNPDARLDDLDMLSQEEQIVLNQEIDVRLSRSFSF